MMFEGFGMMDGPEWEEMVAEAEKCEADRRTQLDAVKTALVENACDCWNSLGSTMVGKLVVVVEVIDETGEPNLLVLSDPDQAQWDTLGLLSYAVQVRE